MHYYVDRLVYGLVWTAFTALGNTFVGMPIVISVGFALAIYSTAGHNPNGRRATALLAAYAGLTGCLYLARTDSVTEAEIMAKPMNIAPAEAAASP